MRDLPPQTWTLQHCLPQDFSSKTEVETKREFKRSARQEARCFRLQVSFDFRESKGPNPHATPHVTSKHTNLRFLQAMVTINVAQ